MSECVKTAPEASAPPRENLLAGLKAKLTVPGTIPEKHRTDWFNSPEDSPELTDGVYASSPDCRDKAWFRFTGGDAREVDFDLGSVRAFDGFRVGCLRQTGWGVFQPSRVVLFASANGKEWQTAGSATGFETWGKDAITRVSASFPPVKARFVKFVFNVPTHCWIDELELFASSGENAVSAVGDGSLAAEFPNRYAASAELGAKDVMLAYMCRGDIPPINKEMLLPYVGYTVGGEVKDTMFDGFLFLPHVFFLYDYSSGRGVKRPLAKKDWEFFMDTEFGDGINLDALEEAAAEVGVSLGKPDLRLTVFLSILYPVAGVTDFGEINGRNLDFTHPADREAALFWLVDEQLRRFREKNYKHLDLSGFYWFTEEISYLDKPLTDLLRSVTDRVRSLGFRTMWIPYYHACGYNDWRRLGFDVGCYQPNYAFNQSVPDGRLFEAAATAKLYGMCIELEMGGIEHWHAERMKKYYAAGALTGYMREATHFYYQGSMPGSFYRAYASGDPYLHSVYDDTYKFIKGEFDPTTIDFDYESKEK